MTGKFPLSAIKTDITAHMAGVLHKFGEAVARANVALSKDRLKGRFGATYSHHYFNEELGAWVPRYRIKHDQTGRLANSTKYQALGNAKFSISNTAIGGNAKDRLIDGYPSSWDDDLFGADSLSGPREPYAAKIAELDQREVGIDAWSWANERIGKNLTRQGNIKDLFGAMYQ